MAKIRSPPGSSEGEWRRKVRGTQAITCGRRRHGHQRPRSRGQRRRYGPFGGRQPDREGATARPTLGQAGTRTEAADSAIATVGKRHDPCAIASPVASPHWSDLPRDPRTANRHVPARAGPRVFLLVYSFQTHSARGVDHQDRRLPSPVSGDRRRDHGGCTPHGGRRWCAVRLPGRRPG